ncbi:MAG: histidine phosphatase family protein [Nitriliruptorales bacterium]|nr:histidine phosphatase family protein [Nitriliruptorales bacterium]
MTETAEPAPSEYRQHRFRLPPGATDILLVRHGESQPARPGVTFPVKDGHADPPLDAHGHHEAQRVAERLDSEDVDAIYVTPLQRTAQTASPLAQRLGVEPRVEPDLREVHLGEWEGAVFRIKVRQRHPLAVRMWEEERWDVIPGAESMEALAERARRGLNRIAAAHQNRRVVVFAHGGIIGMIVSLATGGRTFAFVGADNASITHLVVSGDQWILRRFNDTGHLGTDLDRPSDPLT